MPPVTRTAADSLTAAANDQLFTLRSTLLALLQLTNSTDDAEAQNSLASNPDVVEAAVLQLSRALHACDKARTARFYAPEQVSA